MQMIQFYFIEQWPAIPVFSKWFFADNVSASGHLQEQIKYASKVIGYAAAIFGCIPQILNPHHILESWILSSWMVLEGFHLLAESDMQLSCPCLIDWSQNYDVPVHFSQWCAGQCHMERGNISIQPHLLGHHIFGESIWRTRLGHGNLCCGWVLEIPPYLGW
jgi:hypothetical protein